MRSRLLILSLIATGFAAGCGPAETVIPTGEFTEEQKAAIKAEDIAVEDEESQGKLPKKKTKK